MEKKRTELDDRLELEDHAEDGAGVERKESVRGAIGEGARAAGPPDDVRNLRQERDALLDRLARLQAEFDNYRKRVVREQQDYRDYSLAETAKSLLPVADNLELALRSGAAPEDLRKGVELIRKQFHDLLERIGVRPIEAVGKPFDPQMHEAIEVVPTDEAPDHSVLSELQRGYRLKDRLLRPSMVRVAQKP